MTQAPIPAAATLYDGVVFHERYRPFSHRLRYKVFSMLLDIDKISETAAQSRIFSYNTRNLFSFYESDHGRRDGSMLRPWVEDLLQHAAIEGFDPLQSQIFLFCFPRILGYVFNPLSVFFCYDFNKQLRAIVYEVKNTFGEQHCYVIKAEKAMETEDTRDSAPVYTHQADKAFHVSPFIPMQCRYAFRVQAPDTRFTLRIDQEVLQEDSNTYQPVLLATHTAQSAPFNDKALWARFFRYPLMTLKVIAAIHWEAVHLVRKGAHYFRKPKPPATYASYPVTKDLQEKE